MIKSTISRYTLVWLAVIWGCFIGVNNAAAQIDLEGAIALWLLDEGRGDTVRDSSENGHDGGFDGKPTWVEGKFGNALEFDQRSWVEMNAPVIVDTVAFTMGCWANPEKTQLEWTNILSSHREPPRRGISFEQHSTNHNRFGIAIGIDPHWAGGGSVDLQAGKWNHMAFVRDGSRGTWYLDGKVDEHVGVASNKAVVAATDRFRIGAWSAGGRQFRGKVDEAFIFSRALSQEEIVNIMSRGLEGAKAVTSRDKAATTWGKIKSWHQ